MNEAHSQIGWVPARSVGCQFNFATIHISAFFRLYNVPLRDGGWFSRWDIMLCYHLRFTKVTVFASVKTIVFNDELNNESKFGQHGASETYWFSIYCFEYSAKIHCFAYILNPTGLGTVYLTEPVCFTCSMMTSWDSFWRWWDIIELVCAEVVSHNGTLKRMLLL